MNLSERLYWLGSYSLGALRKPSNLRGLLGLKRTSFEAHWFAPKAEPTSFPALDQVLASPPGLLAIGGKVTDVSLFAAFQAGIFVCHQAHQPTKWWSPDPRMVLFPEDMYLQKTLQRLIRNDRFAISFNQAFDDVVDACAYPRPNSPENWVLPLAETYKALHRQDRAFSVEAWDKEGALAGGVFGLVSNRLLSVESMFTRVNHASKIALAHLCAHLRHWDYPCIDMQMPTDHLASLGCRPIPRADYLSLVERAHNASPHPQLWLVNVKPGKDGTPELLQQDGQKMAS
ncbi:MAG: leucyl/phenylalanyl-tRNA--protein transferase [Pseudomonadota bacterium]